MVYFASRQTEEVKVMNIAEWLYCDAILAEHKKDYQAADKLFEAALNNAKFNSRKIDVDLVHSVADRIIHDEFQAGVVE